MTNYQQNTYGDEIAEVYDQLYSDFDPACIDLLAELAGPGLALELGIGTGRIALPLTRRGVALEGIDASRAMVAILRLVVPRTTESSTTTTDLSRITSRTGESLSLTPKWRIESWGSMKVRPT